MPQPDPPRLVSTIHGNLAWTGRRLVGPQHPRCSGDPGQWTDPLSPTKTDLRGQYQFVSVTPCTYNVRASAKGFAPAEHLEYQVAARTPQVLDFPPIVGLRSEKIAVQDNFRLDVDPANNAGALVLRGNELDALPTTATTWPPIWPRWPDPLPGRTAGKSTSTGSPGRLSTKSSIREVRINQNPFSAQCDRIGMGRVGVFTKPGVGDLHGEIQTHDGIRAGQTTLEKARPRGRGERADRLENVVPRRFRSSSLHREFLRQRAHTEPQSRRGRDLAGYPDAAPRHRNFKLDRQFSKDHTLTLRYTFARDARDNQGAGGFSLPSRIYNYRDSEDSVQLVETGVYGQHTVNETRARYTRQRGRQEGNASLPTTVVLDAFKGDGPPLTLSFTNQDLLEFRNLTTLTCGPHLLRWGGRLRGVYLNGGTFMFSSLDAYRLTLLRQQSGWSPQQIRGAGGGASQFSIAAGNPLASLNQFDVGFFALDDWRLRPNLSVGLRYEAQTRLADHRDFAPRIGIAWGLGSKDTTPKTVLRAGAGLSYDRVSESLSLDALRRDGMRQLSSSPTPRIFTPPFPRLSDLLGACTPQAVRELDSHMQAPRLAQFGVGIERRLPRNLVTAVNYLRSQGWHSLRSHDISAPMTAASATATAIYLYEASGIFRQDQLVTSLNARVSPKLSFTGSYTLGQAHSDTDGAGTFAADPYNERPEYARAGFDIRHRVQFNGLYTAPGDSD
jgi:hypothetical protein